jgi:type IV pilus assembly protein PilE
MNPQINGRARGFTLVELMVVVVIAAILLAVAAPLYQTQVRQARRTDARTAILDLAGREERYFSTNASSYTAVPANLGYPGVFNNPANPVGSGYYYISSVCTPACAPSAAASPSFSIIVLPVPGGSQTKDTPCQGFAVDSTGEQWAETGGAWIQNTPANASAAACWSN